VHRFAAIDPILRRPGRFVAASMVACALLVAAPDASAVAARVTASGQPEDRNIVNFRVGATSAAGRMQMCLEGSPHERIGLEACGTGATWLQNDSAPEPQLMHLRANFRLLSMALFGGYLQARVGAGVTELQVGDDAGGLDFTGTGPFGTETAGPEVGASVRMLAPIWGGIELIGQIDATLSYLKYAPKLVSPQSAMFPSVTATVGFGF
jgi:hypothetical protein